MKIVPAYLIGAGDLELHGHEFIAASLAIVTTLVRRLKTGIQRDNG